MRTVGCYGCHVLLHSGDIVVEVTTPAVVIDRYGHRREDVQSRYLCPRCAEGD